ncbi:MAG: translocation/assembly module TamB domain-containing protein [Rhizobiaceae bacterium]
MGNFCRNSVCVRLVFALLLLVLSSFTSATLAQEEAEKSALLKFVEEQISTDNFRIRLNGLEGTLSSDVSLNSITLADREGVWLTINKPRLIWKRASLLLGQVDVESLSAESIVVTRLPLPDDSAPLAETKPFALPDLPVSILLEKIAIDTIDIDQSVFGLASRVDFNGKLALESGLLDVDVTMQRLDGSGGSLSLVGDYSSQKQWLKLAARLNEPEDGLFVNLLNIENRPPVSLEIAGDGPIADFDMKLAFDVEQRSILRGDLKLSEAPDGQAVSVGLAGPLASILPQQHRAFFGTNSQIRAAALLRNNGEIDISSFAIKTGNLDLDGRARILADGFLGAVQVAMSVLPAQAEKVRLPIAGGDTLLRAMQLNIDYDVERQGGWTASLVAEGMEQPGLSVENSTLVASGMVINANDPAARQFTFATRGQLDGIAIDDPQVAEAVGTKAELQGSGFWQSGQPVTFKQFKFSAPALDLSTSGKLTGLLYKGVTQLTLHRLAAFSGIAQRPLAGQADLSIDGETDLLSGGFDFNLQGTARNIRLGSEPLDGLLQSDVLLSGQIKRGEGGIGFERLRLGNAQFHANLNGRFASDFSDLQAVGKIHDLAALSEQARGLLTVNLSARGEGDRHKLTAEINLPSGRLQNRRVENLVARYDGELAKDRLGGDLSGKGRLNAKPVSLDGRLDVSLASPDGSQDFAVSNFIAEVGATRIRLDLSGGGRSGGAAVTGKADISSTDISDIAALALVDAAGQVEGSVEFLNTDGLQSLSTRLKARQFRFDTYRARTLDLVGSVVDLFGQPKIGATLDGRDLAISSTNIPTISAKIGTTGNTSTYQLAARLSKFDTSVKSTGSVTYDPQQATVSIKTLNADSKLAALRLLSPTNIRLPKGGAISIAKTQLAVGKGRVSIAGSAGDNLNLQIGLQNLPLQIANAVQPDLGARGSLSGQITIGGSAQNPQITYRLNGAGIGVQQLTSAGIANLQLAAAGRFQNQRVELDSLSARNSQNIKITGKGTIPLQGNGLNLQLEGTAPLSLGQFALASRGSTLSGSARFNLNLAGSLQSPKPRGLVTVENGSLVDPLSNLRLSNIGLLAGIENNRVTITRSNASLSNGGNIRVTGSVGLSQQFPADLKIAMNGARYSDGETFSSQLDGALQLTGPLLADPTMSGQITLTKTEISVPESFAASAEILEVEHVQPNQNTAQTLARMERATPKARPTSRPSILNLNLVINAPNQIFIRGRGLDAELGGNIRLTGPVNNISPSGSFQLRRGRLTILGQRLDLNEGRITLDGGLDPVLYLVAQTEAGDVVAYITVSGPASDINVTFSSNPELPEDEVLAQIIFGRAIEELTPSQIIKLASIAAELTGGSSPGLVDSLRRGTGLDDLDIVEGKEGETAVKAGKYLTDNVYVGVQAGQTSQEATINLDITDDVTARGTVDSEGSSSLGIFLEKDY